MVHSVHCRFIRISLSVNLLQKVADSQVNGINDLHVVNLPTFCHQTVSPRAHFATSCLLQATNVLRHHQLFGRQRSASRQAPQPCRTTRKLSGVFNNNNDNNNNNNNYYYYGSKQIDKKFSCPREAARCFVSVCSQLQQYNTLNALLVFHH